jgi:hypothetical protein
MGIGNRNITTEALRHGETQIEQLQGKGTGREGKFTWMGRMGAKKTSHRLTPTNTDQEW